MLLCYRPYPALVTLGSWQSALPIGNALTADTAEVARSTNAALASTRFKLDFVSQQRLKAIAIRGINASQSCRYRFRGYAQSAMTTQVYDSQWIDVFPSGWSIAIPWESPDQWTGTQTVWRDEERRPSIIHYLSEVVTAAAWLIEFDDTANPDGYVQFDRVFAAEFWQPSINYSVQGNGLAFIDQTDVETTVNGVESFGRKIALKSFRFGFDYLPEAEAFAAGYDLSRWAGRDREVLVIPDPLDRPNIMTRSFIGSMSRMDGLAQVEAGYAAIGYEIKELA